MRLESYLILVKDFIVPSMANIVQKRNTLPFRRSLHSSSLRGLCMRRNPADFKGYSVVRFLAKRSLWSRSSWATASWYVIICRYIQNILMNKHILISRSSKQVYMSSSVLEFSIHYPTNMLSKLSSWCKKIQNFVDKQFRTNCRSVKELN